ncbi:MAG: response regulator [Cytophagales bacterium]|nr:MAG: response regulator [Cytophagales bacterium]TAF60609.1 MAG: response regulator [Cytophagales bacterium]
MAIKKFYSVMLVDDNEIDNLINQKMLEATAVCERIYLHTGAKSAIEFLKNIDKVADDNPDIIPEVIFLDIDMPLMDGFQFLDQFENLSDRIRAKSKIVMLTSSINPQDVSRSRKSSYVKKYLNKPLTQDALKKLDI